jgi:hypothetical protein
MTDGPGEPRDDINDRCDGALATDGSEAQAAVAVAVAAGTCCGGWRPVRTALAGRCGEVA